MVEFANSIMNLMTTIMALCFLLALLFCNPVATRRPKLWTAMTYTALFGGTLAFFVKVAVITYS